MKTAIRQTHRHHAMGLQQHSRLLWLLGNRMDRKQILCQSPHLSFVFFFCLQTFPKHMCVSTIQYIIFTNDIYLTCKWLHNDQDQWERARKCRSSDGIANKDKLYLHGRKVINTTATTIIIITMMWKSSHLTVILRRCRQHSTDHNSGFWMHKCVYVCVTE